MANSGAKRPSTMPAAKVADLTVAITGPTGTFGFGLIPLLQEDDRVSRMIGIARRPFDPSDRGWTKLEYRQGDVRNIEDLEQAFKGADVVVHLAFIIIGGSKELTHAVNVEGTLNAFRAAAKVGVQRFVYASSVAAYGFHKDNPVPMTEDWPTRPADRLFYAKEKAELEQLLKEEEAEHPDTDLYLLRPPIVLGPDFVGGKVDLQPQLAALGQAIMSGIRRVPIPAIVPDLELQVIHQDDVGEALRLCVLGEGPPGAYNIAAEDVLTVADVAREAGLLPIPVPGAPIQSAARFLAQLPIPNSAAQWVEVMSHPAIMDITRAKTELGWKPAYSAIETLRATLPTA
jgi:nucleoside-diphosphate-sugar epimerase